MGNKTGNDSPSLMHSLAPLSNTAFVAFFVETLVLILERILKIVLWLLYRFVLSLIGSKKVYLSANTKYLPNICPQWSKVLPCWKFQWFWHQCESNIIIWYVNYPIEITLFTPPKLKLWGNHRRTSLPRLIPSITRLKVCDPVPVVYKHFAKFWRLKSFQVICVLGECT